MTAFLGSSAFAQTGGDGGTAETAAPNAPNQEPAFENQTRAPLPAEETAVKTETIVEDLPNLWSMELLPDGTMLVAAKDGDMMIISADGGMGEPLEGVPEVI